MNKRTLLDTAWYLVVFVLVQMVVNGAMLLICQTRTITAMMTIIATIISSLLTIGLFVWRHWAPVSGKYINTRPWFTLFWVVCLAVGATSPLSFLWDECGLRMPDKLNEMFRQIMQHDLGYLAIGVFAPIAEEVVFRGAIQRRLQQAFGKGKHWYAIVLTAALFGVVHANMVQGVNAFVMGLLLGWMYQRSGSLVPGIVFHLTNNTIAYAMCRLLPNLADKTLVDIYGGEMKYVWCNLLASTAIFIASMYQLYLRLGKEGKNTN